MNRHWRISLIPFLLILVVAGTSGAAEKEMVYGASASWREMPSEEQVAACTHMVLCFIRPDGVEGDIISYVSQEEIDSMIVWRERHGTKITVGFGGGGFQIDSTLMGVPERRQRLITNILDFIDENDLDGMDNDWEPIFIEDEDEKWRINEHLRKYYGVFTEEFRDSLDNRFGVGEKLFSASIMPMNRIWYASAEYAAKSDHFPLGFWEHLDYVLLMGYDNDLGAGHGSYSFALSSIEHWHGLGVPKEKMVLGIPFYGRGAWSGEDQALEYNRIFELFPNLDSTTDLVTYDPGSGALPYGFNSQATVVAKQDEVKRQGAAGVMVCFINFDLPIDHPRSLLRALQPGVTTSLVEGHRARAKHPDIQFRTVGRELTITAPSTALKGRSLNFYTASGKEIHRITVGVSGNATVDLTGFAPGIYLYQIDESGSSTGSFIVK